MTGTTGREKPLLLSFNFTEDQWEGEIPLLDGRAGKPIRVTVKHGETTIMVPNWRGIYNQNLRLGIHALKTLLEASHGTSGQANGEDLIESEVVFRSVRSKGREAGVHRDSSSDQGEDSSEG